MNRLFFLLVCVLSSSVYAADDVVIRPLTGDISIALLHAFFPIYDVGGPVLIGVLMRLLNLGVTAVVAVILGYLAFFGTIGSAIDGNELGRKLQFWTGMRVVLGTVFLVPAYNGFSSLQAFILWMVINGVGLADALWSEVMTLLVEHPAVVSRMDPSYWQDLNAVMGLPTQSTQPTLVSALMRSELCLELKKYQSFDPMLPPVGDVGAYRIRIDQECGPEVSGICYGSSVSPSMCGFYPTNPSIPGVSQALAATASFVQQSLNPLFDSLEAQASLDLSAGQKPKPDLEACHVGFSPSECPLSRMTLAAASNYLSEIEPLRVDHAVSSEGPLEAVLAQGWAVAGYYYTRLLTQGNQDQSYAALNDYVFPYQSNLQLLSQCGNSQTGYMYAYCYLDQELSDYASPTRAQTQNLYEHIYESSAVVQSASDHPNNMVNDPVVNYATALLLNDLIYRVSDDYFSALEDSSLSGFARLIIKAGAALTGSGPSTASVAVVNLMNLALCSAQAVTGIVVYDQGCRFNVPYAPSSVHCTSRAVREACTLAAPNQCLNTAVAQGCISQTHGKMGLLGSFYYNQTHPVGENPMYTVAYIGWTFMQAALSSLMGNMQQGTQLVINAGMGLMAMKLPFVIAMDVMGATLEGVELQLGTGFILMGLGGITSLLDMAYQMVLYQSRFMFDGLMMLNTLLMGYGAMYAIYFPSVPMIIYTLGVVGWLAVVIEAMIAAPLIAAGVTYPQGGQFLGAAEQGLALGFSVFLRPVLLVIGLYMSAVLAQVAMHITHYTCLYFIAFMLSALGIQSSFINILFMFMLSLVYLFVTFEILSHVYTFIAILPDRIMRWFLAGSSDSLTGQSVQQQLAFVREQVQSAAEHAARAASTTPRAIRMLDPRTLSPLVSYTVGPYLSMAVKASKEAIGQKLSQASQRVGDYARNPQELRNDLQSAYGGVRGGVGRLAGGASGSLGRGYQATRTWLQGAYVGLRDRMRGRSDGEDGAE